MSREQFTPPSLAGSQNLTTGPANHQPSQSASGSGPTQMGTTASTFSITGANSYEDTSRPVNYLCGDCDARITLKKGDAVRCKECGYRVLYKERTNR